MFVIDCADIHHILKDFGIFSEIRSVSELQRNDYEHNDYDCEKEVRLIVKVDLKPEPPLVIRFKNETDVTLAQIESQSRFADELRKNGITTPYQYRSSGGFAKWYTINGYRVIVTLEQFEENEVRAVDPMIARKTGELLARTHNISEKYDFHVHNKVLFDPFSANDLFDFESFQSLGAAFEGRERKLFDQIVQKHHTYMEILAPLKEQPRYAVQGDISNCNLYQTRSGEIGIFDFNRCGDNNLFCDAIMQAVFEARLMDYPDAAKEDIETKILQSFLCGYRSIREFTKEQQRWYPYLFALIDAFWSSDIRWSENSLTNAVKNGNKDQTRKWLGTIWQRLIGQLP